MKGNQFSFNVLRQSCAVVNFRLFLRENRIHFCEMKQDLPIFRSGEIVRGFGRGSKELGIPTANYALDVVKSLPSTIQTGIYCGWAQVNSGDVYKMVMSIGWNPFYENKEKSMETHILHEYNRDLYGELLKVCILEYLRPEKNFNSLEELISAIKDDIKQAGDILSVDANMKIKNSDFFKTEWNNNDKTH